MNIIIMSPKGFGKTTVAQKAAKLLRDKGMSIGGILNPAHDVLNVATGEQRLFTLKEPGQNTIPIGKYHILPDALEWAITGIKQSHAAGQWTFIDECGKLELQRHKGYHDVLTRLVPKGRCVVCVRDINVKAFFDTYDPTQAQPSHIVMLHAGNRDDIHTRIAETIIKDKNTNHHESDWTARV